MTRPIKHYWRDHDGHWHEGVDIMAWVVFVLLGLLQLPWILLYLLLMLPGIVWIYLRRENKDVRFIKDVVVPLIMMWWD